MKGSLCLALILILSFYSCNSINVQIFPDKEYCFKIDGGEEYVVEYIVSGVNETQMLFTVSRAGIELHRTENQSQYSNKLTLPGGVIDLCFKSTDNNHKTLSLDFFHTKDPIRALITKQDLKEVETELHQAVTQLQNVYRNQHYQMERDFVHKSLLEETETKIKITGFVKILVLCGSALIQLWIMKTFFKDRNFEYSQV